MAGQGVTLYAVSAAGNKAIVGTIDWRENIYTPSQINDNLAQIMADIRAMANSVAGGWIEIGDGDGTYTATYVSATSFQFSGIDVTPYYRAGMRVRIVAPTPGTIAGTITAVAFSTNTTITVTWDSGAGLSNEAITSVSIGIGSGGSAGGQLNYRNILGRNGGFEVWQRGAGGSASINYAVGEQKYAADGWYFYSGNQAMTVWQTSGIVFASRYCCVVQRNAGQTGAALYQLEFPLDIDEIVPMRNSIVTLSFTAIAGANFSAAGQLINALIVVGTGAAPGRFTGGGITSPTNIISVSQALTTTPTRYTFTASIIVPTGATQASVVFNATPVGTAGASDYFIVDDVQLEIGSVATPFERRPFDSELLACQRHYWKTFLYGTAPAQNVGLQTGYLYSQLIVNGAGLVTFPSRHRVQMRAAPTITTFNPSAANPQVRDVSASLDCTGVSTTNVTAETVSVYGFGNAGSVAPNQMGVHITADAGI